jgi:uncharacterized protein (TIGR00369 family)
MPFEHHLGVRVVERHDDGVTCECPIRPELMNGNGVMHGGIIACIADEAAWWAMDAHTDRARNSTTAELKVNYLLPITGEKVLARVVLLRVGRTLCVSRVDMFGGDGRLAAAATVTYIFQP